MLLKNLLFAKLQHTGSCDSSFVSKDGASFCYCAYVLRISGYSGFLKNLPTNTTFFRGL